MNSPAKEHRPIPMSAHKLQVALTPRALRDLRGIQLYSLQQWGTERADVYDKAIQSALRGLSEHPELGMARDDLRPRLRCLPVEQHLILYRITDQALGVQRIIHARQDLGRTFPRRPR
jgi:toxin ParE1/3/4